jgi:hypothetical protein
VAGEKERARADARTDEALAAMDFRDPRPAFRERLRWLREEQPNAFTSALAYYEQTLVPALLDENLEPLGQWLEYGRHLGELTGAGKTVAIDESGRARPYRATRLDSELVIHVPNDTAREALALAVPNQLSDAQRANFDLLIGRARALSF